MGNSIPQTVELQAARLTTELAETRRDLGRLLEWQAAGETVWTFGSIADSIATAHGLIAELESQIADLQAKYPGLIV